MKVMNAEWRDRVDHWVRTLKEDFYEPLGEISWTASRTMEHLSPEEAGKLPFVSVQPGFVWGNTWEYCWFQGSVILPERAEGKRIVLNLEPDGESTLFVNGKSFGTYRASWVSEKHHYVEDNVLTREGKAGERFDILMETYAGHYYPEAPTGGCATGPVLEGLYQDPLEEGRRRTLGVCTFGIWDEDAYQLYMDVQTLLGLLEVVDLSSLRAAKIAEALERFTLTVDFEQDKEARQASYREASRQLRPVMEAGNGSTQPVFYAVGNAHLDLAWLWPMAETHRKTSRTFAAQLRLLEEYPEYKFLQSQPASYEMCRKYYPELFERIREAIGKGQWIAEGAMWVEPDTNMASGEALIRQLVHGKRYYKDVLGTDSVILWLPDTFGYTAALPQILQGCGVKYLVTQKIFWSYNDGDPFPYHYFTWRGMDGSEVTSFLPTSYTYRTDPREINDVWKNRVQARDLDAFLLPFGYGDGGGGPARDYVEYAVRQKDIEGGVKVKMAGPLEFFEDMEKLGGPKNTYVGELYFSAHRGTYSAQADIKKNNRRSELMLREMEMWACAASLRGWAYPIEQADGLWKTLLLHQFHDILPGSSIARVYAEANAAHEKLQAEAAGITADAAAALMEKKEGVTVFNSLSFDRKALITLPEEYADGAAKADGTAVPVQKTAEGVKALVSLPSCGAVSLYPEAGELPAAETDAAKAAAKAERACIRKTEDGFVMENGLVSARINGRGEVVSFRLKKENGTADGLSREYAAGPMNRLRLFKDVPRKFDAWDIDSNYVCQEIQGAYDVELEPVEEGLEAVLKAEGRISRSSYTQYIRLAADSRRLEFETIVDWKELHRLLKTSFPVNVYAENGINEIQFGYVERPAHRSRPYDQERFEVCNHHYSAFRDENGGAAVLNNCKYGVSMNGNSLELTLLRASASPEMRADNKVHHFTYAFTAWEGSFMDSDVVRQGYELNVKPYVAAGSGQDFSLLSIDRANIILDTMKPAEDGSGDIILRLYESKKAETSAGVQLSPELLGAGGALNRGEDRASDCHVYACDMLENVTEELPVTDGALALSFHPFEIKTVRISRGK